MKSLAVVGSGIAGLGAAYFLKDDYTVTVFEQDNRLGGHSHTLLAPNTEKTIPVDSGFMVFNHETYPLLTRLFQELGVATQATDMSFSLQLPAEGLEWSGASFNRLFGQRKNILSPRFWRFLLHLNRFNQEAASDLNNPALSGATVADYIALKGLSEDFLEWYLIPMGGAIWSTRHQGMLEFPIQTLIRFFANHGFLGMNTQFQWYTVTGGSREYVKKLVAQLPGRIETGKGVKQVSVEDGRARLVFEDGTSEVYDAVILAAHADQSLKMLADATPEEHRLLSCFTYERNAVLFHSDDSVMPHSKACWASWNYHNLTLPDGNSRPSTHYWMNVLQKLSGQTPYLISLNADHLVSPDKVHQSLVYDHPLFSVEAVEAQQHLPSLNNPNRGRPVYFCGSYFRYGFHEDALLSAATLAQTLTGRPVWP